MAEDIVATMAQETKKVSPGKDRSPRKYSLLSRKLSIPNYLRNVELRLGQIAISERGLIKPGGTFSNTWDIVLIAALLFTSTVTPYEVVLLPVNLDTTPLFFLFIINRVVDLIFLIDLNVNFRMMFYRHTDGFLVKDRRLIRKKYLHGWFTIDVVTLLPFDLLSLAIANIETLKLVRLFRLLKLLRILRASRVFARWEAQLGFAHSTLVAVQVTMALLLTNHTLALAWILMAKQEPATAYTWITKWLDNNPVPLAGSTECHSNAGTSIPVNGAMRTACYGVPDLYIASLHWAMMTVTSIGYGDITPTNSTEFFCSVIFMMVAGVSWAKIIAEICSVVTTRDPVDVQYHQICDDLNQYMSNEKTDSERRFQVRKFISFSKDSMRAAAHKDILKDLPAKLAEGLTHMPSFLYEPCQIRWLNRTSTRFCVSLLTQLQCKAMPPQEVATTGNSCFILYKGCISETGTGTLTTVQSKSVCWGQDFVFCDKRLVKRTTLLAITFVELHHFGWDILNRVLAKFPEETKALRVGIRWQVCFALTCYMNSHNTMIPDEWENKNKTKPKRLLDAPMDTFQFQRTVLTKLNRMEQNLTMLNQAYNVTLPEVDTMVKPNNVTIDV